jgi:hypothetical protein
VVNPAARLTGTLEWPIAVSGFFLNFFWEMAQSAWYVDVTRKTYQEILVSRLHCTLGDVAILLVAYWITAGLVRNRYWVAALRPRDLAAFTGLGLGYTMVSEWVNVDLRSAWGYADTMPRLPWIGTGLAPVLQWLILPTMTARVARRLLRGWGRPHDEPDRMGSTRDE